MFSILEQQIIVLLSEKEYSLFLMGWSISQDLLLLFGDSFGLHYSSKKLQIFKSMYDIHFSNEEVLENSLLCESGIKLTLELYNKHEVWKT